MSTYLGSILYQVLTFHNIQHRDSSSTSQVVTTKSGSQLSIYGFEFRTDQDTSHRKAIANPLCNRNHIGTDTCMLVSKKFTATPVAGLYFIQNKYCIHFFASLTQFFQEFHFRNLNTAYSLNTFNNHRTDISFCQFRFSCFYIVQRQISHMPIVIDWGYNFRIVGYLHCQ